MTKVSAFVLRLSEKRQSAFDESLMLYGNYAEAVDEFSYSRNRPLIVFILNDDGRIAFVGQGRRGSRAGYGQRRLNVTDLTPLNKEVFGSDVLGSLAAKFVRYAKPVFSSGGLLPRRTFQAVVDVLVELAPETKEVLDRYSVRRRDRIARLNSKQLTSLAYQKDAVATAMQIAHMDRATLALWSPPSSKEPTSFLEGLPASVLREDPMIIADMKAVPGYEYIKTLPHQATAVFHNDKGESLTVVMANRQPLENQTGADLIYYNERFKAFLFVQYKAMDKDSKGNAIFRFPNAQLSEEISRMDQVLAELAKIDGDAGRDGFRLSGDPFFLKFCPKLQFDPDGTGLVAGMYLPLGYWKATVNDNAMTGPKGGKRISYENVGRYFDNTSFVTIVSGAWVGTTIPQSEILESYIRKVIISGKAIAFAVKSENPPADEELDDVLVPSLDGGVLDIAVESD